MAKASENASEKAEASAAQVAKASEKAAASEMPKETSTPRAGLSIQDHHLAQARRVVKQVLDPSLNLTGSDKLPLYKYQRMNGDECIMVSVKAQQTPQLMRTPFFGFNVAAANVGMRFNYRQHLQEMGRKGEVIHLDTTPVAACYRLMSGDFCFNVVLDYTSFMEQSRVLAVLEEFPKLGELLAVGLKLYPSVDAALPYRAKLQGREEEGCFRFCRREGVQNGIVVFTGIAGHALVEAMMHLSVHLAAVKALGEQERKKLNDFVMAVVLSRGSVAGTPKHVWRGGVLDAMDSMVGVKTDSKTQADIARSTYAYWKEWCVARMQQFPVIEATMRQIHERNPMKLLLIVHSMSQRLSGDDHGVLCGYVDAQEGVVVGGNLVGFMWGLVLNEAILKRKEESRENLRLSKELV